MTTIQKIEAARHEIGHLEGGRCLGAYTHGVALRQLVKEKDAEILSLLVNGGWPDVFNVMNDASFITGLATSPMLISLPILKALLAVIEDSEEFRTGYRGIQPIIDRIAVLEAQLEAEDAERGKLSNALREAEELARAKAEAALGRDPTVLAARKALEAAQPAPVAEPPALIRGRQTIPQPALA